ncbi:MAG: ATP-binding cassette domain-containing protein [Candidatus Eisenbacteria bacterium]|nr:ATP-binding cassette domain-containing protein [Candidatus Eisenbacteria bacterium]
MWFYDEDYIEEEQEKEVRHIPLRTMIRRIWPRFRPHRRTLILAAVLMLLAVGAELAGPLIVRHVLDNDIPDGNAQGVLFRGLLYVSLFAVGMAAAYVQVVLVSRVGLSIVMGLRQQAFDHILNLSLGFFDKNPPGRLMARVESDIERLRMLFSDVAMALLRNLVLLGGTLAVMLAASPVVTGSILLIMAPMVIATYFFLKYIRRSFRTIRKLYARISSFLAEYVTGIPVLQLFGYTETAQMNLARRNKDKYSKEVRVFFREYAFWGFFSSIEIAAVMVIIYVGARQLFGVAMTVGTLVLFIEYTRRLFWPLIMFSEQLDFIQQAFASADRVFSILDTPSLTADRPDAEPVIPSDWRELAFENVSFEYEKGAKALQNVSFKVRRGEKVALVGLSGGGKTTITNLLLRFYEPTEGAVTLDGRDIRVYRQREWRKKIGLVLQDIHLFPGTLGDNLRVMRKDIGPDEIDRAMEVAQAASMVGKLPRGYDTELSEGGANLSMGERQLLCFARAIVDDPDILILDEATSSVDPLTERRLQDSLDHLLEGRTSLIIAHRLATVASVDRILVVHEGRLVEEGNHAELYAQDGVYRDLFDLQFAAGVVAQRDTEGGAGDSPEMRHE